MSNSIKLLEKKVKHNAENRKREGLVRTKKETLDFSRVKTWWSEGGSNP